MSTTMIQNRKKKTTAGISRSMASKTGPRRRVRGSGAFYDDLQSLIINAGAKAAGTAAEGFAPGSGAFVSGAVQSGGQALGKKAKAALNKTKIGRRITGSGAFYLSSLPMPFKDIPFDGAVHVNALAPSGKMPDVPQFVEGGEPGSVEWYCHKVATITAPSTAGETNASYTSYSFNPAAPDSVGAAYAAASKSARYLPLGIGWVYFPTLTPGTKNYLGSLSFAVTSDNELTADTSSEFNSIMASCGNAAVLTGPGVCSPRGLYGECDPNRVPGAKGILGLKCRRAAASTVTDINSYDWCQIIVKAVAGADTTSAVMGELWFFGAVRTIDPQRVPVAAGYAKFCITAPTALLPLGTSITTGVTGVGLGANLSCTASTRVLSFGTKVPMVDTIWDITYYVNGTAAVITCPILTFSNCEAVDTITRYETTLSTGNTSVQSPANGTTSTSLMFIYRVRITGEAATVTFGAAGTIPTSASSANLTCALVGYGLVKTEL